MNHRLHIFFLAVVAVLSLPAGVQAQVPVAKGRISGRITDDKTGEGLTGASAKLKGTYYGSAANIDGDYNITNINPGEYALEISLVGYTSVLKTGVKVEAGKDLVFNFKLKEASVTAQEVTVIGERPLLDIEQAKSSTVISTEMIALSPASTVRDLAATQVGVVKTPDGLHIRGGRSYETGYYVDGVSAQDPLAGTGFGLNLNNNALQEIEITTGGSGAEYGDAPAGIVAVKIKEGGDKFFAALSTSRDNFGFNNTSSYSFNASNYSGELSGPIKLPFLSENIYFFGSLGAAFTDDYFKRPAQQLKSSIAAEWLAPYNNNAWEGLLKLTYKISGNDKLTFSTSRSISISQDSQALQITGNDQQLQPGFQFGFYNIPDNANVYTHDTQILSLGWVHTFSKFTFASVQLSRLFTQLRTEANGRPWRPDFITEDLDPQSIRQTPIYSATDSSVLYTLPSDGLYNTGIAPLWHDHRAEDFTFRADVTYNSPDDVNRFLFGNETKLSYYYWIDITRPWVGAPLAAGEPSRSLGSAADVWEVRPALGAFYASDNIKYKGLFATLGLRLQYWFPGSFLNDAVADPNSPVPDGFRQPYLDNSYNLFGQRFKLRLLPKVNVSFPVSDNQVLHINYSHSTRQPHPRYLYAGLDIRYIDNSIDSRIGNPSLEPETTVSYEFGLKNQFTQNDLLTLTAFYNDKFDYIVSASIFYTDKRTGGTSTRLTFVNQDYARIRGFEIAYKKRIGSWFDGNISFAYQVATGKSNSAEQTAAEVIRNNGERDDREFSLAWDRPIDAKAQALFKYKEANGLFGASVLNDLRLSVSAFYSSGLRYTPAFFTGGFNEDTGRPDYESDPNRPNENIGAAWFYVDLKLEKAFRLSGSSALLTLQVRNLFNNRNSSIVNPTTGRAYEFGDPVVLGTRDPAYPDVQDGGLPPTNPARYLAPLNLSLGFSLTL